MQEALTKKFKASLEKLEKGGRCKPNVREAARVVSKPL